jgi:hypothetical protein
VTAYKLAYDSVICPYNMLLWVIITACDSIDSSSAASSCLDTCIAVCRCCPVDKLSVALLDQNHVCISGCWPVALSACALQAECTLPGVLYDNKQEAPRALTCGCRAVHWLANAGLCMDAC